MIKQRTQPGLRILLTAEFLTIMAAAMLGPIQALFVEEVGGDILDAGYAGSAFGIAAGLTTLVAGRFADATKHPKRIIALGYVLTGLGFLLLTAVHSIWHLLAVQLLIGLAAPLYTPALNALYTRHINPHQEGYGWSLWDAIDYFATAVGAILGGLIASRFGFDPLFVVMALICLASAGYILFSPINRE